MILYLGIIVYIISIVASIILLLFQDKISLHSKKIILFIHFAILLTFIYVYFVKKSTTLSGIPLFLLFISSGLLVFALFIKQPQFKLLKLYLFVFPLSFTWFVLQPGNYISFITMLEYNSVQFSLEMNDKYYVEQQNFNRFENKSSFKVYKKSGLFTKVILRDINLAMPPDSGFIQCDPKLNYTLTLFSNNQILLDTMFRLTYDNNKITKRIPNE